MPEKSGILDISSSALLIASFSLGYRAWYFSRAAVKSSE